MLWCWTSLLSLFFFLSGKVAAQSCVDETGKTQSGNHNYVIDSFTNTFALTYAIDQCTETSLLPGSGYSKYTCEQDDNDVWWIIKTAYETSDCSEAGLSATWSAEDYTEGEMGYFKCDGDNTYVEVQLSLDSSCQVPVILYGGLGGCASNPDTLDFKFYCDSTSAALQLYISVDASNSTYPICDDTNLYCNKWALTKTCALTANVFGSDIYGYMTECVSTLVTSAPTQGPTTASPTTAPTTPAPTTPSPTQSPIEDDEDDEDDDEASSASSQFALLAILVSLITGLLY